MLRGAARRSSRDLLPWLPPPTRSPRLPSTATPPQYVLTNAEVLRAVTASPPLSAKQLLALYSRAAKQPGFRHNYATYAALLPRLAFLGRLRAVELLLGRMRRERLPIGPALMKPLLDNCVAAGFPDKARDLFLSVPTSNESLLFKIVGLLIAADRLDLARGMFTTETASRLGFELKIRNYLSLLKEYCDRGDVKSAVEMLDDMSERGLAPNVFTYGILICRVCRAGRLDHGFELLEQMRRHGQDPDLVIWNTLLHGCVRSGEMEKAQSTFQKMEQGVGVDIVSFNTLIDGTCKNKGAIAGLKVFGDMFAREIAPDSCTFTILMAELFKENRVVECCILFGKMLRIGVQPDIGCCGAFVRYVCKEGHNYTIFGISSDMLIQRLQQLGFRISSRICNECSSQISEGTSS